MRSLAGLALAGLLIAGPAAAKAPVLVELYTSQGCGACADANAYAAALAAREDVLPLTFSVAYQDYLGWRDTFAKPEFSERQKAYAKRLTGRPVYTPQLVVDGSAQAAGARQGQVERLIDEAVARQAATQNAARPRIRRQGEDRISVGAGSAPKGGAEVWLIRYDPRNREVEVQRGENRGKVMAYRNVVRDLRRLGGWTGAAKTFRLPDRLDEGLKSAIVVQQPGGGRILALWTD